MMNQRQRFGIYWYEFARNEEVARILDLPSINVLISQPRHAALCGHVKHMDQAASVYQALHLFITTRQPRQRSRPWRRPGGRPEKCWVEQIATSTKVAMRDVRSAAAERLAHG